MADWERLRELTHEVAPPDFDSMVGIARRRQRRARVAVGALATLVLVGGGLGVAAVNSRDDQAPVQPSQRPSGSRLPDGVQDLPPAGPGSDVDGIDAGRYRIPLDDGLAFDIDLAGTSTAHEGGLFLSTGRIVIKTEIAGEGYGVPRDPCTDHVIKPVGPTVDDLVRALTDLAPYKVSSPRSVRLGDASGTYLEARIPRSYDASHCDGKNIELPGSGLNAVSAPPPYVGRWWVVDVEGRRVMIQQNCWSCTPQQLLDARSDPQTITFETTS
jgi:hypothetical protein